MSLKGSQGRRHHRSGWQPLQHADEQIESVSLWSSRTDAGPPSVAGFEPVRVALGTGSKKPSKSQLRRLQTSSTAPSVMLPVTGCALKLALSPPPAPLREHNHQWYCVASVPSSPLTKVSSDENTTHADAASPPKRLYFLNRDQCTYRTSACKSLGASMRIPSRTATTSETSRPSQTTNKETTLPGSLKKDGEHSYAQVRDSGTPERTDGLSLRPFGTSVDVTEGAPGSDTPIPERRRSTDCPHSRHSSLDPVEFHGAGIELERGGSAALTSSSARAGTRIAHHRKGSIVYFRPNEPLITPPRHARSASTALCSNASSRGARLDESSPERPGGQIRPSPHRLQHHAEELLLANVRFLGERVRELEDRVVFLEQENESLRHALSTTTKPTVEATNLTINPGDCSNDALR
ncbi:hypothetical protein CCYA_CCYA19G4649 [Cyanidiococcus yangmingshanensis]|nr:hypothetical protein CCYA_CCYA19G4649 [Cyanidiococcus yangmingshanensis]